MKRANFITGAGLAAGAAVAPGRSARARPPQFRWKLQSANPAGTPHMTLLNKFAPCYANHRRAAAVVSDRDVRLNQGGGAACRHRRGRLSR